MYVKFLIVTLLPIALARHFLSGRHELWTHVDPGLQFNFRNADSENFGVHQRGQFSQYSTFADYTPFQGQNHDRYGHYERYVDHNTDNVYRHGNVPQTDQDVRNIEQSYRNSEYHNENDNRRVSQHEHHDNQHKSFNTNKQAHSHHSGNERKHHGDSNLSSRERSRTIDYTGHNNQATLKTNVDSKTTISSESTTDERTNYHLDDNTPSYDNNEYEVRINEDAKSVKAELVELSKNPELRLSPRVADTRESHDNLPEVSNDTMIFADNPKPITSVKTTTDNELRFNKNGDDSTNEDEKWIWSHPSTTTTTTTSTTLAPNRTVPIVGGELDDRVSFTGDGCPKGEAKVLGQCVPKRN